MTMTGSQATFDVRCEWGEQGIAQMAPTSDVVAIVDVMSFSTSVDTAASRGAVIFPYPRHELRTGGVPRLVGCLRNAQAVVDL
jgi:2-phosphosulfolactate phosphatase